MSTFHCERKVKARVQHECEESGTGCVRTATILPGQVYVRVAGKFDGQFYSVKLCARCARVSRKVWSGDFGDFESDEGPVFGGLLEWLAEALRW